MSGSLNTSQLMRQLIKYAPTYPQYAFVQQEVARRVLSRFDYIRHDAKYMLDMSLHVSDSEQLLRKRFPKATYLAAMPFRAQVKQRRKFWVKPTRFICMPWDRIPLRQASVDLIFMNLRLLWVNDWPLLLKECRRVLAPKGVLLFTTLGPDTLFELRDAFSYVDGHSHVHEFVDMHVIGDALLQLGFENPVVDRELLTMHYASFESLIKDLRLTGSTYVGMNRFRGLLTPRHHDLLLTHYPCDQSAFPATFEVIYGHAFMPERLPQRTTATGEVLVPLPSVFK